MDILDLAFYYFIRYMKQYALSIPRSASILTKCKVFSLDMTSYVGIKIDKGKSGKDFFPKLEKLNGTYAVQPSSLSKTKDFCFIEPRLYDQTGKILYEMCKFDSFVIFYILQAIPLIQILNDLTKNNALTTIINATYL